MGKLSDALFHLDKQRVLTIVAEDLQRGRDPLEMIEEAREGLELIGAEFEKGNLFLMELMRAAQIFKSAAEFINPKIRERYEKTGAKGKVLIGTVAGDVHDLGKGIVSSLLECAGYEVIDLGVDVAVDLFLEKIREHRPQVVGMSGLLTTSIPVMKGTAEAISKSGLREEVKLIVGGGIVGEIDPLELGVDYSAKSASEGVRIIEGWIKRK